MDSCAHNIPSMLWIYIYIIRQILLTCIILYFFYYDNSDNRIDYE